MVNYNKQPLDPVFSALADGTRRSILATLAARGAMSVGEIATPFDMSLPAVSKHLDVLEAARLIVREKRGRTVLCHIDPTPMEAAMDWLARQEKFWTERLDALAAYVEEPSWNEISRSPSSAPSKPRRRSSSKPGPTRKS